MGALLDRPYTCRQATYDVRRLRRKGFIERIEGHHADRITPRGRRFACFLTKVQARVVLPGLTELEATARPRPPTPRPLAAAWRSYEREVEALIAVARISAKLGPSVTFSAAKRG